MIDFIENIKESLKQNKTKCPRTNYVSLAISQNTRSTHKNQFYFIILAMDDLKPNSILFF